ARLADAIARVDNCVPIKVTCSPGGFANGCCIFNWTVCNTGVNAITTFYLDLEAGSGARICNNINNITLPGFTGTFCYTWDFAVPSNWAVVCFANGNLAPGACA